MTAHPLPSQSLRPRPRSNVFPRGALIAGAVLILASMIAAGLGRFGGYGVVLTPYAPVVEVRALQFTDEPDGAVLVRDAVDGSTVHRVEPGNGGFIRGVMRGFVRDRKMRDLSDEAAFLLMRQADARLVLNDPLTGRTVDLGGFGETNVAAFARLLGQTPTPPQLPGSPR